MLKNIIPTAIIVISTLGLVGCATTQSGPITPRSSLSKGAAKELALTMSRGLKGGHIAGVKDTGSMLPMFHANAWLVVEEADYSELQTGDIVIYKSEKGYPIVHQIVAKTHNGYKVKGVNNINIDQEVVTQENFSSRVAAILYFNDAPASSGTMTA